MLWILFLIITFFIKIDLIYIYIFIFFTNALRGWNLIKNKSYIFDDINVYMAEDGFYRYRTKKARIKTALKWFSQISIGSLLVAILIGGIYPYIFSAIYLRVIASQEVFYLTIKLFIISELGFFLGELLILLLFALSEKEEI